MLASGIDQEPVQRRPQKPDKKEDRGKWGCSFLLMNKTSNNGMKKEKCIGLHTLLGLAWANLLS